MKDVAMDLQARWMDDGRGTRTLYAALVMESKSDFPVYTLLDPLALNPYSMKAYPISPP
jgi:hypothetical protein